MIDELFNFIPVAMGQAQSASGAPGPSMVEQLALPFFLLVIVYFFILRPQAKKAKAQNEMITNLKAGDEVVSTGGIIGRIKTISDTFVTLDAGGSTIKLMKSHVSALTKPPQAKSTKA